MKFHCPHCNQRIEAPDDWADTLGNCPECHHTINLPSPARPNPLSPDPKLNKAGEQLPNADIDWNFMMEPNRQRRLVAYGSICVLLLLCSVPPFFSSFARPGRDFWIQFLPALLLAALGVFCGWKFYRLRGFTEGAIGMIAKGVLVAAIFVALLTAGYPVAMWCSKRCKYSGCWEEGTELAYYSGSDRSSVLHHYCKAHREKAPSYLP